VKATLLDIRGSSQTGSYNNGQPRLRMDMEKRMDREMTRLRYSRLAGVVWTCRWSLAALFLTYIATSSVFPGLLGEDSKSSSLGSWYPILLISLYNASDAVGKLSPIYSEVWLGRQPVLLAVATIRALLLVPCLVTSALWQAPVMLMGALTIALGITNG
jgi:equilibrative nucleoside transporter 1/2/3